MAMKERMVAIRASIADIINGSYGDDNGPRVISPEGVELRRVLLIGTIVNQVTGNNFASITIDDGTETIRAKAWGAEANMLERVSGDMLALVVGKVREYESEVYVVPEIVREVDNPNLMTLHKLERRKSILRLGGMEVPASSKSDDAGTLMSYDTSSEDSKTPAKTTTSAKGLAGEILEFIKKNEASGGVRIQAIAEHFEAKGIESLKIQLELIDLVDQERIVEEEVGLYRSM
jgi:RPA family protein